MLGIICLLLPPMVCSAWLLVVGGVRCREAGYVSRDRDVGVTSAAPPCHVGFDKTQMICPSADIAAIPHGIRQSYHATARHIADIIQVRPECFFCDLGILFLTLILRRSRTGTVWFYTSTSNKRAARPKLYTKSLTKDLKLMYSRLTLVRISINL